LLEREKSSPNAYTIVRAGVRRVDVKKLLVLSGIVTGLTLSLFPVARSAAAALPATEASDD
jgi:hypothetical protein